MMRPSVAGAAVGPCAVGRLAKSTDVPMPNSRWLVPLIVRRFCSLSARSTFSRVMVWLMGLLRSSAYTSRCASSANSSSSA